MGTVANLYQILEPFDVYHLFYRTERTLRMVSGDNKMTKKDRISPLRMTDKVWSNAFIHPDFESILYDEKTIQRRIAELGGYLTKEYDGLYPIFVSVMTGGVFFFADLIRYVVTPCTIDAVNASSYFANSQTTSGEVHIQKGAMKTSVKGRHVVLVEDIVDTGHTAKRLTDEFMSDGALSVEMVCLLDKPARRQIIDCVYQPSYVGFEVDDLFVVGYGLDYEGEYRNVPYIGVLKPAIYEKEKTSP